MSLFSKPFDESRVMDGIRTGGSERRFFENILYQNFTYLIRDGARRHTLSEDDSSIVYSDTILTVIEHLISRRFEGRSGIKTYVHQIFTNKCVDLIRKHSTKKAQVFQGEGLSEMLNLLPDDTHSAIQTLMQQQDVDLLRQRLTQLGDKCHRMLWAWGEGFTDVEIAREMGYQSAAVSKTSRQRCLDRLRELYLSAYKN
ncbi:RNA polymerase sigma factor [Arundinibacter roseus]|uniref:Sigma-70 family RNA polymerase sigma factor n=1 Tax=Arundinibacter roseus TaxID=2070510 RepID=A0A4V2X9H6_9BACT|nr:sigma-70 family RNA polymerase sigma factor [Arundinibacter roseus]TDB63785.1 sigma-70 family RNA polymerase sigma factor [Arundinibacter roseus]